MILRFILITLALFVLFNCSSNSNNKKIDSKNIEIITSESQYIEAMKNFDNQNFIVAENMFQNIIRIYPLSNEAIQSQIMSGFIDYIKLDYDSAIFKFTKLIKRYPTLKNIDYVYYMIAQCYYEQISHEGLDGEYNNLALESLNQVINRFPNSQYAKDSYQKIILVKSNIAAKHMNIGRFYQKDNKLTAALNRYKIVVESFYETKFTPEALYRISEIYYSIGMIEESTATISILGYNFPESKWYEYGYNNLSKNENSSLFSNSIDKILNK